MNFREVLDYFTEWALNTGTKIVISLLVLLISFRLITRLARKIEKKITTEKNNLDKTLVSTIVYLVRLLLKVGIAICIVGYLGIDTGGLTALIASLGVGVGLAVNGALSNFAGGALILLTRPFKIDDFIEAQGYSGTVEDIHIITTKIKTADNKVVYIPNGSLSAGTIVNYSEKPTRRIDLTFLVCYKTDIALAKALIERIIDNHENILKDPVPMVRVSEYAEHGITILARAFVRREDYFCVQYDLLEEVKIAFDKAEIVIPYNQLVIHIENEKNDENDN